MVFFPQFFVIDLLMKSLTGGQNTQYGTILNCVSVRVPEKKSEPAPRPDYTDHHSPVNSKSFGYKRV